MRGWFATSALLCFSLWVPTRAAADEPLHARVDRLIEASADGPLAELTSDAEFMRRVWLDFAGRIPTAEQTRAFLADTDPEKRTKLIDQLLAGLDYPRQLARQFHILLMERQGDQPEWLGYLERSFTANKPWDQMVREILNPDPNNPEIAGAAFFTTKRLEHYGQNAIDYPGMTRDVGRLFMGVDLQCAQCHDHPQIDDYKQVDFQGLFVVYTNTFIRTDTKVPAIGEKPLGMKLEFTSVFTMEKGATGPRLPFGMEVEPVAFKPGEEFKVPPDKKAKFPGIPKFSQLEVLSEQMPRAENSLFARNIVNRLWFLMMGRGIVHPLDLHHSDNPPSHPELLELLATEFTAKKFDIKWLLGELARTRTYQRSSVLPAGTDQAPPEKFRVAIERRLSAEQLLQSLATATGEYDRLVPASADSKPAAIPADLEKKFVTAFGNAPKDPEEDFSPTLKGALFILNDGTVAKWFTPRDGNLIDRVQKLTDDAAVAEKLYLAILSRPPVAEEVAKVKEYLAANAAQREKAIGHLAWALAASTEFCTNH